MHLVPNRISILISFLFTAAFGLAQTSGTGAISGVVNDPTNRVVAAATVVAVNQETHARRIVKTTNDSDFRVVLLPPGQYEVSVQHDGFATANSIIHVSVCETASLKITPPSRLSASRFR